MKNRAMLLCIKNNIETIEEYARKIGIAPDRAESILKEQVILTQDEINANCKLFNCSSSYFLAITEK